MTPVWVLIIKETHKKSSSFKVTEIKVFNVLSSILSDSYTVQIFYNNLEESDSKKI